MVEAEGNSIDYKSLVEFNGRGRGAEGVLRATIND